MTQKHAVRREERTFDILVPLPGNEGRAFPVLATWMRYEHEVEWRFGQLSAEGRTYVWRDIAPDGVAPQWVKDIALAVRPVETRDTRLYLALEDVNALLREAGIEYPTGLVGLRDLVQQRDGATQALGTEQVEAWSYGYKAGERDALRYRDKALGYVVEPGEDTTPNPYVKES